MDMACVVEIITYLRGSSKDDAAAREMYKKKVRLECDPDSQTQVVRSVKLAANICGVHTRTKEVDGVFYLITPKSKPTFVTYRIVVGQESVDDSNKFWAHEWRHGDKGLKNG
jgi:hypothetical protein